MKTIIHLGMAVGALLVTAGSAIAQKSTMNITDSQFEAHVVTTASEPWEIRWGPDGYLWVTEKGANRIARINPTDGSKQVAVDIKEVFSNGRGSEEMAWAEELDGKLGLDAAHRAPLVRNFWTADLRALGDRDCWS